MSRPLEHFTYQNGVLTADRVSLVEVADTVGTPVYVYSASGLLEPLALLQKGLAEIDHLVCFAVKSNSNLAVLKLLVEAGAGMDIVSGGELYRAGLAGTPAERIVFSGVGKTPGEMARALEVGGTGILSFNVESVAELSLLSEVAHQAGKRASVSLRFNPDVNARTHPYISTGLKQNKFGVTRKELLEIARNLDEYPGIRLDGLSIHIGSQLLSLAPLEDSFRRVRAAMEDLEQHLPGPLSRIDLGGGVGITYNKEKAPTLQKYCALILKYFGPRSKLKHPVKIVIEPGRTISGNAGVLVSEVLYRKVRSNKDFLIVDAGMNDLIRPSLYGSYHEIVPVEAQQARGKKRPTDVVGPVCETGDCFASARKLPVALQQNDLVAFLSAGAYGFSMSGNYNSRPRPPEVLLNNGSFRVIRERETYEDLVRGEKA